MVISVAIGCSMCAARARGEFNVHKLSRYPFWIRDIEFWRALLADLTITLAQGRIGVSAVRSHYWPKGRIREEVEK